MNNSLGTAELVSHFSKLWAAQVLQEDPAWLLLVLFHLMQLNTQVFLNHYIRRLMHTKALASFLGKLGTLVRWVCDFQMHLDNSEQLLSPTDQWAWLQLPQQEASLGGGQSWMSREVAQAFELTSCLIVSNAAHYVVRSAVLHEGKNKEKSFWHLNKTRNLCSFETSN